MHQYDEVVEAYAGLAGLDGEETTILKKAVRFWGNPDAENVWEKLYPGQRLFRRQIAVELIRLRVEQIGENDGGLVADAFEDIGRIIGAALIEVSPSSFELRVSKSAPVLMSARKVRGNWSVSVYDCLNDDRQLARVVNVLEIEV